MDILAIFTSLRFAPYFHSLKIVQRACEKRKELAKIKLKIKSSLRKKNNVLIIYSAREKSKENSIQNRVNLLEFQLGYI